MLVPLNNARGRICEHPHAKRGKESIYITVEQLLALREVELLTLL